MKKQHLVEIFPQNFPSQELSLIMAAQSAARLSQAAGSSSSSSPIYQKEKTGLFVLSVLFLLGFALSFRKVTTDASLCEEKQQRKTD